ncbi:RIMB2 protein, partial [Amia calva]|nr:RIMB2 protein [Amia calva]
MDFSPSPDMPRTVLPTLPLSAGEAVQVTGVPDSHGLYHAEVKGEVGLVPACFLIETEDLQPASPIHNKCSSPRPRLTSPERIINLHHQLKSHCSNYQVVSSATSDSSPETDHSSVSTPCLVQEGTSGLSLSQQQEEVADLKCPTLSKSLGGEGQGRLSELSRRNVSRDAGVILNNAWLSRDDANCSAAAAAMRSNLSDLSLLRSQGQDGKGIVSNALFPEGRSIRAKQEPPLPVGSVEIVKTVGHSSLMIGWERPPLDELGCSNGIFVYGYRIYVDGEFHKSVMSSACTKAVLENVDLSVSFQISVQTLGANGLFSEKVHAHFQSPISPAGPELSSPDLWTPHSYQHGGQPNLKSSSLRARVKPTMFVAIYNYSPLKDSPNIHPSRELAFKEGDPVWVFGKPRRDGFCEAEANGRQGLAPLAFLEEANVRLPSKTKENAPRMLALPPGLIETSCVSPSSQVPSAAACEHTSNQRKVLVKRV